MRQLYVTNQCIKYIKNIKMPCVYFDSRLLFMMEYNYCGVSTFT